MTSSFADSMIYDIAQMDHSTSLAVCNGIGERLRDIMRPGAGHLPPRLQELMDQLQHIDDSPSIVPQMHPVAHAR
ncbi:MAG: hypothetical protein K2X60_09420 [Xanthobacteraceae bacterium]|nr:hypothetical protein [Xanthobacteraceae bacterium]